MNPMVTMRFRVCSVIVAIVFMTVSAVSLSYAGQDGPADVLVPNAPIRGFTKNTGQVLFSDGTACPDVLYTASRGNMRVFLTKNGLTYVFQAVERRNSAGSGCEAHAHDDPCAARIAFASVSKQYRTDIVFKGANPAFTIEEQQREPGLVRIYRNGSTEAQTLESFGIIEYRDIYPGIDARFYMTPEGLKYEFIVGPGGNPADIRLQVVGVESLGLSAQGCIEIGTPLGTIREAAPESFELASTGMSEAVAGSRIRVSSRFRLDGNLIGFDVERSNPKSRLVIDPFVQWSTYLGGDAHDAGNAVDFLPSGDIVAGGFTASASFPVTPGVLQEVKDNFLDGYLARFTAGGSLVWATYIGGDIEDVVMSLDVDANGDIVAAGYTTSSNFPATSGAFQENNAGGLDAFVAKISPDGVLLWATLFGGSQDENCEGVTTDPQGNIIFTGYTWSSNLPRTANAFQLIFGGDRDAYLAKFRPNGTRMWATFYGGTVEDWGHSVSTDKAGNIYCVGHAHSKNFPTSPGSFQPTQRGYRDGYLLKFAPDGTRIWATLIGLDDWDDTYDLDVDETGHIAVVGATVSARFPVTPNAFQLTHAGLYDCIVMRFRADGTLQWSTFAGKSEWDMFHSVATFPSGNMMVAGFTGSRDMWRPPFVFQEDFGGGSYDMYVMKILADGQRRYATYLGGAGNEYETANRGLMSIATNVRGEAVLIGKTSSADFPVLIPNQGVFGGDWDATLTKWACTVTPQPFVIASGPLRFCAGDSVTLEVPAGYKFYRWSTGDTTRSITVSSAGTYIASVGDEDDCFADAPPVTVTIFPIPQPQITPSGVINLCQSDSVTLDAGAGFVIYQWSNGASGRYLRVSQSMIVSVTVLDSNDCSGTSLPVEIIVHPLPQPVITALGPVAFCQGGSVVLDAGAGYTSYLWSTGDTTATVEIDSPGSYTVRVTDEFGCENVSVPQSVVVFSLPQPIITPLGPVSFCIGDSVILDAGPGYAAYLWSTGASSRTITVETPGDYGVSVTTTDGCVDSSLKISVAVFPLPQPVITASGPLEFCEGNALELDAGGGFGNYVWSSGETTQRIIPAQSGTYSVTVSSGEGCTATSPGIDILIHPTPQPTISPSGFVAFCEGDSAILTASGGFASYRWSTGGTDSTITVKVPGTYSAVVTDRFGCEGNTPVVTVAVYPNPPKPAIRQSRDTLFATPGAAGYIWYLDGNEILGETRQTMLVPQAGVYTVAALSQQGCLTLSNPFPVVIANMTISLPDIVIAPGQRATIPLIVESADLFIESGARNFIATISFDKRILADISPATGWTMDTTVRRIRMNGSWDAVSQTLGTFEVLAMLGPVKSTGLVIEDIEWLEGIVATTTVNGSVTLLVCEEGGDRLFDGSGQVRLAQNTPNPFNGMTVLQYEIIEKGYTQLFVTDLLGRRVATLYAGNAEPGAYTARFDAGGLPTGRYYAVLLTPAMSRIRLMQLVK